MKSKILKMLRESGEYISGQDICDSLGISRTAVWKYIKQLKEEGYEIEAVQNRGYHLLSTPDVMTEQEILSRLVTKKFGRRICCLMQVDSTNNYAKKIAEDGAEHGTLVVAESQSNGKGRRGRTWDSPRGCSIFMSYLLRPVLMPQSASMLTLVAGLSVSQAIGEVTQVIPYIKWPNDIVVNGRKICGILTEMSADPDMINYVVVGIGININMQSFPKELEDKATSLRNETGIVYNRSEIIAKVCQYFERNYEIFCEKGDMTDLIEEYNKHLVNVEREVRISDTANEYTGVAKGIDKDGKLLVEMPDGTIREVFAGEVSVRGLYGYV